jgi:MarR family transcriptional regulator, organic hydroperoxide resistance regulator
MNVPLMLDDHLCFAIHTTAHAFSRAYRAKLKTLKLTYPQYLVMKVLWERDGQTVSAISERLFLDSGTVTPLLKRLEAVSYIKRTRDEVDERRVFIHLTPIGRSLYEEACKAIDSLACIVVEASPEYKAVLLELHKIRAALNVL